MAVMGIYTERVDRTGAIGGRVLSESPATWRQAERVLSMVGQSGCTGFWYSRMPGDHRKGIDSYPRAIFEARLARYVPTPRTAQYSQQRISSRIIEGIIQKVRYLVRMRGFGCRFELVQLASADVMMKILEPVLPAQPIAMSPKLTYRPLVDRRFLQGLRAVPSS